VLLDAMGTLPRDHWLWLGLSGGTLALAITLPRAGMIDGTFAQLTQGLFPLLPWGVLVMAGAAYAKWNPSRAQTWGAGLAAVGLALALWALGQRTGHTPLYLSKWPLTAPYVLLFGGASVLLMETVRLGQGWLAARPRLVVPLEFLSSHLLLGAVFQYLPLELLYWLTPKIQLLQPGEYDGAAALISIVVGSLVCLGLFYALLPLTLALWKRIAFAPLLRGLREHRSLVALVLLSGVAVLCSEGVEQILGSEDFTRPGKPVAACVMIYLALELQRSRLVPDQSPTGASGSSRK
jgi:hypothetical protein